MLLSGVGNPFLLVVWNQRKVVSITVTGLTPSFINSSKVLNIESWRPIHDGNFYYNSKGLWFVLFIYWILSFIDVCISHSIFMFRLHRLIDDIRKVWKLSIVESQRNVRRLGKIESPIPLTNSVADSIDEIHNLPIVPTNMFITASTYLSH